MEYYPASISTDLYGIFKQVTPDVAVIVLDEGELTVSENNRALPGDTVYYVHCEEDTKSVRIVGIKERLVHRIPAVLVLNKTKIIGTNKKNIPMYQAIPVDWKYPEFFVASKIKDKLGIGGIKNQYILIEFHQWTTKQKFPQARQVSVIGTVGDINAELKVILHKNNIYTKSFPKRLPKLAEPRETLYKRTVFAAPEQEIFAIDPATAQDFDDAFHVCLDGSGKVSEINVHIADVTAHFTESSPYESEILKRLSTIYMIDRKYNMIPNQYADDLCSLVADRERLTVTVRFCPTSSVASDESSDASFLLSKTTVTHNISYENANKLIKNGTNRYLTALADYFKTTDSHIIVEKLMITANMLVGQALTKAGQGLIRVQKPVVGNYIANEENEAISEHLLNRSSTSAFYAFNPEDKSHYRLSLNSYTHFTSPIRRYPDVLVHRLLKTHVIKSEVACTLSETELTESCLEINRYYKRIKKLYREQDILKLYHQLNSEYDGHYVTEGYPVEYSNGVIYVFIPKFDIEYKYRLFSKALQQLITETVEGNRISITVESTKYEIELYHLYNIQLTTNTVTPRLNSKIKMRIL